MTNQEARHRLHLAAKLLRRLDRMVDGGKVDIEGDAVRLRELAGDLVDIAADLALAEALERVTALHNDDFNKRVDLLAGAPLRLIRGGDA
jgi:hypothetical protein